MVIQRIFFYCFTKVSYLHSAYRRGYIIAYESFNHIHGYIAGRSWEVREIVANSVNNITPIVLYGTKKIHFIIFTNK